jgi:hypothetical protein
LQVAIVAVAAHLSQHPLGERFGLPALAQRYRQDVDALEQVFEYIMQSLANYRSMHMRMQQLAAEGALDGGEVDVAAHDRAAAEMHAAAAGNIVAAMSDLDGFTAKLSAILQADLTHAALAAGPLEVAPNLMQQLGSVLAVEPGTGARCSCCCCCCCCCRACIAGLCAPVLASCAEHSRAAVPCGAHTSAAAVVTGPTLCRAC